MYVSCGWGLKLANELVGRQPLVDSEPLNQLVRSVLVDSTPGGIAGELAE